MVVWRSLWTSLWRVLEEEAEESRGKWMKKVYGKVEMVHITLWQKVSATPGRSTSLWPISYEIWMARKIGTLKFESPNEHQRPIR